MNRRDTCVDAIKAFTEKVASLNCAQFSGAQLNALREAEKKLRGVIDSAQRARTAGGQQELVTNKRLVDWLSMTTERAERSVRVLLFLKERCPNDPIALHDLAQGLAWPQQESREDYLTESRRKLEALKDVGLIEASRDEAGCWSYELTERGTLFMESQEFLSMAAER